MKQLPLRVLWVTGDELPPAAGSAPVEVHVISAALPPGETRLDARTSATAEGVDWLWRRYPLSFVPGLARVEQVLFAVAGRPREAVRLADRDRELRRHVQRRVSAGLVDVVLAVGTGAAGAARGCGVPVVALPDVDAPDGEVTGLRAGGRRLDRWAAKRWTRRVLRPPVVLGDRDEPFDAALALVSRPSSRPPTTAATSAVRTASVVVATANRPVQLRESLPFVAAAARRVAGTEVIVVEQGSSSAEAIRGELGVDAVVVHDDGRGASRSRNIGAARAIGDVVLFTDDDCVVPESWVVDHLAALSDGEVVASFGAVTGLSRAVVAEDPVALDRVHRRGALPWHIGHGSNMATRRDALRAAGGWDERIGPGTALPAGEDADLIVRLLEVGGARSGVGVPVRHLDWRSDADDARNVRAYELGAGVWIGKAIRAHGRSAFAYGRARWRLVRLRREAEGATREQRADARRSIVPFVRGVLRGLRLR